MKMKVANVTQTTVESMKEAPSSSRKFYRSIFNIA